MATDIQAVTGQNNIESMNDNKEYSDLQHNFEMMDNPDAKLTTPNSVRSKSKSPLNEIKLDLQTNKDRSRSKSPPYKRSRSKSPIAIPQYKSRSRSKSPIEHELLSSRSPSPDKDHESQQSISSPEPKKTPLFDLPLEISGKRERRNTERLSMPDSGSASKHTVIPKGKGTQLGACPQVNLSKARSEELKTLHRLLFGNRGQQLQFRKHIRDFSGFDFSEDSPEYEKKIEILNKCSASNVKDICVLLNLKKSSSKDVLAKDIMEFLMCPKATNAPASSAKKRKSPSSRKSKQLKKTPNTTHDDTQLDTDEEEEVNEESLEQVPQKSATSSRKQPPEKTSQSSVKKSVKESVKKSKTPASLEKNKSMSGIRKKLVLTWEESEGDQGELGESLSEEDKEKSEPTNVQSDEEFQPSKTKKVKTPMKLKGSAAKGKNTESIVPRAALKKKTPTKKISKPDNKKKQPHVDKFNNKQVAASKNKKLSKKSEEVIYSSETEEDLDATVEDIQIEEPHSHENGKVKLTPTKSSPHKKHHDKTPTKKSASIGTNKHTPVKNSRDDINTPKSESNSDGDNPLEPFPTEDEIKNAVEELIANTNLMEITMKGVCKTIYSKFSSHDLTSKKEFIKSIVKTILGNR